MAVADPVILAMMQVVRMFTAMGSKTPPPEVKTEIEKIREHARDRARANAPIRTGALRKGIDVAVDQSEGRISFGFVSDQDYVIKTHEEQYRLGPTSKAEPTTPEGGVGNKYFTRVVDRWGEIYMDQLMLSMMRAMGREDKQKS